MTLKKGITCLLVIACSILVVYFVHQTRHWGPYVEVATEIRSDFDQLALRPPAGRQRLS